MEGARIHQFERHLRLLPFQFAHRNLEASRLCIPLDSEQLADYSKVDMVLLWYEPVNVGAKRVFEFTNLSAI